MRSTWLTLVILAACSRASKNDAPEAAAGGLPCGALGCMQYADARDAVQGVLAERPLVLAIGEAHALRGAVVPSAARRFADEILPMLQGRASDLLVELMMPPTGCPAATSEARAEQSAVTSQQAAGDQSEYLAMGERARALGIVPDLLRPTCTDLKAIGAAGDDAIDRTLRLIARLTASQAERLVARNAASDADHGKIVVIYGGAIHNDLPAPAGPSTGTSPWSYAPELDAHVGGRLVALDLIVPEFVGDDPTWRSLAWWSHYDRAILGRKATLFRTGERSYTVLFPEAEGVASPSVPGHR
jgi:hypothetical protein